MKNGGGGFHYNLLFYKPKNVNARKCRVRTHKKSHFPDSVGFRERKVNKQCLFERDAYKLYKCELYIQKTLHKPLYIYIHINFKRM